MLTPRQNSVGYILQLCPMSVIWLCPPSQPLHPTGTPHHCILSKWLKDNFPMLVSSRLAPWMLYSSSIGMLVELQALCHSLGLHGCFGPLEGTGDPRYTPCPTCGLQFLQCVGPLGVHADRTAFWHRDTSPLTGRVWAGCRLSKEHHPCEPFSRTGFSPTVGTSAEVLQFSIESLHSRGVRVLQMGTRPGGAGSPGDGIRGAGIQHSNDKRKMGRIGPFLCFWVWGGRNGRLYFFFPHKNQVLARKKMKHIFRRALAVEVGL